MKKKAVRIFCLILLSVICSYLLALSFPQSNIFILAWISLFPIILTFYFYQGKISFFTGLFFGIIFYMQNAFWLYIFAGLITLTLGAIHNALYIALFGLFSSLFYKYFNKEDQYFERIFFTASLWTILEYIKNTILISNNYGDIYITQHNFLQIIQFIDITGSYGLSFLIILVNSFIAEIFYQLFFLKKNLFSDIKRIIFMISVPFLISLLIICGNYKLNSYTNNNKEISVAIIQPNITKDIKFNPSYFLYQLETINEMTKKAVSYRPYIITMPETVIFDFIKNMRFLKKLEWISKTKNLNILFGSLDGNDKIYYNSAYLITPENGLEKSNYKKVHLVPFGEYIPFKKYIGDWKILEEVGGYTPGTSFNIFSLSQCDFAVPICFESNFPYINRKFINKGAGFLITITNDMWYDRTNEAEVHMAISVFRSIENRTYTVFCNNTGPSSIIEPTGRLQTSSQMFERKILYGFVKPLNKKTVYTKYGEMAVYFSLFILIYFSFLFYFEKSKNRTNQ